MLISPGVEVDIINEVYTDSGDRGTIPLVVIATASNKLTPSGSGVAPLTVASQANRLHRMTSRREIVSNFGNPYFWSNQGTPLHAYELNEIGLHCAWSILGAQDSCYVVRADIDLAALAPSRSAPTNPPANGTYWFDYENSSLGVFVSNGNAVPGYAWEPSTVLTTEAEDIDNSFAPLATFGDDGDLAMVPQTDENRLFEKVAGAWVEVGSVAWKAAHPTKVTSGVFAGTYTGTFQVNGVTINAGSGFTLAQIATAIGAITNIDAVVVDDIMTITNIAGGDITVANLTGSPVTTLGLAAQTYEGVEYIFSNGAWFPTNTAPGSVWVKMTAPANGTNLVLKRYSSITGSFSSVELKTFRYNNAIADGFASKDSYAREYFGSTINEGTVYLGYDPVGARQFRIFKNGQFVALTYEASLDVPTSEASEGALWYSPDFKVDLMVNDGSNWKGYSQHYADTDPSGIQISASMPQTQSDGTDLVENDLWLNSSDLENYPAIYRFTMGRWALIDNTDQSTPFGIVFADARADSGVDFTGNLYDGDYEYSSTLISDLLLSDFVDPDAPDARLYPAGTLLFNTRYSTYNVKEWRPNHFTMGGFDASTSFVTSSYTVGDTGFEFPATTAGRWVTVSGNKADGSPYMGRKAQRAMVVRAMQKAVVDCEEARSEHFNFTIMASPGYPELIDDFASLNRDRGEEAITLIDVPARIHPSKAEMWAKNHNNAAENGDDGLVTFYNGAAAYYGWGLSTNVDGSKVMVPATTLALRAYLYSDRVSQVWFPPAGEERGVVTNAEAVGYLNAENEFTPVVLNRPQLNIMAECKINPIVHTPNRGIHVMGQKTLSPVAGALDRVQGVRLAGHLRYSLRRLVRPFIFQQNDSQTRGTAEATVSRFFNGLMTLRAISDYAVLVDDTNNTPERRARHELWIDCAIQPIFAVEFIYIPCRFVEEGASL